MTSKPTVRERFEEMQKKKGDYLENIQFLISLVEAAVEDSKSWHDLWFETRKFPIKPIADENVWRRIDERMAEGEK